MGKKKKTVLCITEAIFLIVAVGALAVYYPFFIEWSNTAMLIICPVLATLGAGGLGANAVIASKNASKLRIVLSSIITMAVFYTVQCVTCLILNNTLDIGKEIVAYESNEFAICCSYIAVFLILAVLLIIFFRRLYGKKPATAAGGISVFAVCVFALCCFRVVLPTQWIYPVYRVFVPQGGAQTEEAKISYGFQHTTVKIQPTDNISDNDSFSIYLAKNEREGCQLSIAAKKEIQITVSIGDFTDKDGNTLETAVFREAYLEIPYMGNIFSDTFPDGSFLSVRRCLQSFFFYRKIMSYNTQENVSPKVYGETFSFSPSQREVFFPFGGTYNLFAL